MAIQEQVTRATEFVSIPIAGVAWLTAQLGVISTIIAIAVGLASLASIWFSIRLKRKQIAKT